MTPSGDASAFDPLRIVATLDEHRVRYVLIGGLAARLHGSPSVTNDLDLCYARDEENLRRLAAALHTLDARLRGVPDDVPFRLEWETLLAGDHFTFVTDAGNLDVLGHPGGTEGFADLARTADPMEIGGASVMVAAIEDLIRMKLAAGRSKDRVEIEILAALLDETREAGSPET